MFLKLCFSFAKLRKFRPNFDLVFREISRNSRVISRNTKLKISRNYENENFRRQPTWDAISVTKKGFVIQFLFLCKNVCRTEVVLYLYSYATSSGTYKLRVKDSLWWAQKPCDGLDSLWNQQLVIDSTACEGLGSLWGTRQLVRGSTACEGLDICDELYSLWGTRQPVRDSKACEGLNSMLGARKLVRDSTSCEGLDSLWGAQKPCDGLDSLWGTCSLLFVRPHWELGQSRRFKDVTQCNMELMWGWGEGGWGRDMRCGGEDGG